MNIISVFVIAFREVLEIALTVLLVVLGTESIPNRKRWIVLGLFIGVVASLIVARSIDALAASFAGAGHEVFQGSVLVLSAALIVWTVVWMKRHAKELAEMTRSLTAKVVAGDRHLVALSTAIGLTVLRDGSEVAVLSHGLRASGMSLLELCIGGGIAIVAGSALSYLAYLGIIRLKAHKIFLALSFFLIFLAAGMVSQSAGFFSSVGLIPEIHARLWDTSWIIDDRSYLGQFLHVLVGYSSRPSAIQVISYLLTVVIAFACLYGIPRRGLVASFGVASIAAHALSPIDTHAIDTVYSPLVHEGEVEIEARGRFYDDHRDDVDGSSKSILGVGYGINSWWAAEVFGELEKTPGEDAKVEAVALENRFQLTEQGEYLWDVGLYAEYEFHTQSGGVDALEGKLLLQNEFHRLLTTANVIFERQVGSRAEDEVEFELAANSRYRLNEHFEPGIEWQAEFGAIDHIPAYSEQEHVAGVMTAGTIVNGFKYEMAFLFGVSESAPDRVFRWLIEYEFNL